jgi:hypothetical protein
MKREEIMAQRYTYHPTPDVVVMFARQGVALATIARALAIPVDRVEGVCRRARERGDVVMIPPVHPNDARAALLSELTNVRAQLDDAQATIRELSAEAQTDKYTGVCGMTRSEGAIAALLVKQGRASKPGIFAMLYGMSLEQPEPKIIDVFVCKMRRKLKPAGIAIGTLWSSGYEMSQEHRLKLREMAVIEPLQVVDAPDLVPALEDA